MLFGKHGINDLLNSRFSICVPTIDRPSLWETLRSLFEIDLEVEICVYANKVSPDTSSKLLELQNKGRIILGSSNSLIPSWHSMRNAISLASRDYIWLLGDDDKCIPEQFNKLVSEVFQYETNQSKPDIILLDGWTEKSDGTRTELSQLPITTLQQISNPSQILNYLCGDLHTMNNGRFIISKELTEIWKVQPDTILETFHEEYRALYESIIIFLRKNQKLSVVASNNQPIILGDIKKSWSEKHFKAVFGELIMLQRLDANFEPAKSMLFCKHLKKRTSFKYLLGLRMITIRKVEIPQELHLSRSQKTKLYISNKFPIWILKIMNSVYRKHRHA